MKELQFPQGFLWGAATSSYQIEGGITNDWSEWEKSPQRLAALKAQGQDPRDFQTGQCSNSWEMMEADIECLKQINATAYRFSIEWARIEPEEGRFDEAALNRYSRFIARLREEGIEPFVTLWHWPLPLWLHQKKAWETTKIIPYFKRYAERLAQAFPTVKFWITLNEATVYAGNSYFIGVWPPQRKNPLLFLRVLRNLAKAHRAAYDAIKEAIPEAQIGLASPIAAFEGATWLDKIVLMPLVRYFSNYWFIDKVADKQDFIGLNYYFHQRLVCGMPKNKNERLSEMGWELYPQGIYQVIVELAERYQKPIYITESGIADEHDTQRAWYMKEILKSVWQAIEEGVDVRSHLAWSLIDNFEWAYGFKKKFGLFSVDRKTFARSPRPSVAVYAKISKNNSLSVE